MANKYYPVPREIKEERVGNYRNKKKKHEFCANIFYGVKKRQSRPYLKLSISQHDRKDARKLQLRQVKLDLVSILVGHLAKRLLYRIVESLVH